MSAFRYSISQIRTYLDCPQQYHYRYIRRVPVLAAPSLTKGIAIHQAAETALLAKMREEDVSIADLMVFVDAQLTEAHATTEWTPEIEATVHVESQDLVALYATQILPQIRPAAVEVPIDFTLGDVPMVGRVDVVEVDGTIRDLKTSKRKPSHHDLDASLQATAYWEAVRQLGGEPPSTVIFDYLVQTKTPAAASLTTERGPQQVRELAATVEGVVNAIEQGHVWPNWQSPYCGHCPFQALCHREHGLADADATMTDTDEEVA